MKDDLTRFIVSLRGSSSDELATLLVLATVIRLKALNTGVFSSRNFDIFRYPVSSDDDFLGLKFNNLIRDFQKAGQPSDAAGAMIWLHSVRASQNPEIRMLGRSMWRELSRGVHLVDEIYEDMSSIIPNLPIETAHEALFVPLGLEPEID